MKKGLIIFSDVMYVAIHIAIILWLLKATYLRTIDIFESDTHIVLLIVYPFGVLIVLAMIVLFINNIRKVNQPNKWRDLF